MKITFSGANREVTGSCYHLETAHQRIVLDCGMFQGGKYAEDKNSQAFPFDPAAVDNMVVTHAHFDHIGRLPKLYKEGFRGTLYGTEPTAELAMINLRDSAKLIMEEAERHGHEPLYTADDVEPLEAMWKTVPYHKEFQIGAGVSGFMADAGHILGSASVKFVAEGEQAVFSGDLGNTPVPLLRNAECLYGADIVVVESTYGNRIHETGTERTSFLKDAIHEIIRTKGTLLIPAFALERTQELLYELNELHATKQIPTLPIFLDSPLAIAATEIFRQSIDFFNPEAKENLRKFGGDLFSFAGLRYTTTSEESKHILKVQGPKIIIAGSGMMNGGRIMHHLKNYLQFPNTTVLIVGYQVEGSLGRKLHDGEKHVVIYGQEVHVKAKVKSCGAFSGHADYPRLMHWMHCFNGRPPKKVFVTHGELNSALSFSQSIEEELSISSGVPEYAETVDTTHLAEANA
ncbi:MAG TPA: MBL fold metallo-hydrolase [Verrucomicrobiae bacterium]|nr:MBL fold metallo-hydrolase [Verrucomicrobiae bacterium]